MLKVCKILSFNAALSATQNLLLFHGAIQVLQPQSTGCCCMCWRLSMQWTPRPPFQADLPEIEAELAGGLTLRNTVTKGFCRKLI